jgi:hypothetical protein
MIGIFCGHIDFIYGLSALLQLISILHKDTKKIFTSYCQLAVCVLIHHHIKGNKLHILKLFIFLPLSTIQKSHLLLIFLSLPIWLYLSAFWFLTMLLPLSDSAIILAWALRISASKSLSIAAYNDHVNTAEVTSVYRNVFSVSFTLERIRL